MISKALLFAAGAAAVAGLVPAPASACSELIRQHRQVDRQLQWQHQRQHPLQERRQQNY